MDTSPVSALVSVVAVCSVMLAVNPIFRYVTAAIWLAIVVCSIVDMKSVEGATDTADAPGNAGPPTK